MSKGDDFAIQSAQFVNTGTLTVNGGTLSLGTGYFENDGSITTTNSTIIASSLLTTSELLSLLGGGDTVSITGTLNNAGTTLSVGPGTAVPTIALTGTIEGGTIADATGALALDGGTLSAVTYEGPLNLAATNALIYLRMAAVLRVRAAAVQAPFRLPARTPTWISPIAAVLPVPP